jgi:hypothetical protein
VAQPGPGGGERTQWRGRLAQELQERGDRTLRTMSLPPQRRLQHGGGVTVDFLGSNDIVRGVQRSLQTAVVSLTSVYGEPVRPSSPP